MLTTNCKHNNNNDILSDDNKNTDSYLNYYNSKIITED